MKRIITFVMLFIILFSLKYENEVKALDYFARSYIVMDSNTGEIMEGKDYHLVRSVASISKIMTAIVAIENTTLDTFVEVKENILKAYGSSIYLKVGEVVIMEDLLYGLLLRSGNDAAVTIANGVSGSEEEFVKLMNKKANEIGMKNSTFHNPSGLDVDDEGNLSTSYDMALLMKYALKNDTFRKITSAKEYKSKNHGVWINKNKLMRLYEYTSGGKTGFTTKARRTLVTSAKKEDTEFIVVTLDCGGDFAMHKSIYEKYFDEYKTFKLLKQGINNFEEYDLECSKEINITLKKEEITNSNIVYEIRGNEANVVLNVNEDSEVKGSCSVTKNKVKKVKKNWLKKLFNL